MSNAIVMNTLNGAVSEYSGFEFHAITPTHAGSVLGLYLLGGNLDIAAKIIANVVTGKTLINDATQKKFLDPVYFSMRGSGTSTMRVYTDVTYSYTFPIRASNESRAIPGRGIRANYLAFGYSNTDGADFELDRIEVMFSSSKTRRV